MSDAEQDNLQTLVHRIATHIVEGSAAIQEFKSTIARLKNERSNIEYVIYEHWLKASKIIEAAGKDKSSWEKFINSLKMNFEDDKETSKRIAIDKDLLKNASKELWTQGTTNNLETTNYSISVVENVDHNYCLIPKSELLGGRNYLSKGRTYCSLNNIERLAEAAMTIGEPNYNAKNKRKWEDSNELHGEANKKKPYIHFQDGRKLSGEQVSTLKKDRRCFYCEQKGHIAVECRANPANERKE